MPAGADRGGLARHGQFQPFGQESAGEQRFGRPAEVALPRARRSRRPAGQSRGRGCGRPMALRRPAAGVPVGLRIAGTKPPELIDDLVEPLALDQLHGVEGKVALPPHLEHRDDIGVVQPCRGAGLAAESLADCPVAEHLLPQDLQRHVPAQQHLLGLVHDAHAAAADLAEDPVVADLLGLLDRPPAAGTPRSPPGPRFRCSGRSAPS